MHRKIATEHHHDVLQAVCEELLALKPDERPAIGELVADFERRLRNATRRIGDYQSRERGQQVGDEALEARSDARPTPEHLAETREALRILERESRTADPPIRAVLGGLAMGLTYQQMGRNLDRSTSTIERYAKMAREWGRYTINKTRDLGASIRFVDTIGAASYNRRRMANDNRTGMVHRGHRLQLRLERSIDGLYACVMCPEVRHIGWFVVVGERVNLVATAAQANGQIENWRVKIPNETERVLVFASGSLTTPERHRGDPDSTKRYWEEILQFLANALGLGWSAEEIERQHPGYWEVDERIIPRLHPGLLRRGGVIPKPGEQFRAALREAGGHGREQRFAQAAAGYRRVLEGAVEAGDVGAEVQATVGLWIALRYLGFEEAADHSMISMLARQEMDTRWANWVAQEMSSSALLRDDPPEAQRWLQHSNPEGDEQVQAFHHLRQAQILLQQQGLQAATDYLSSQEEEIAGLAGNALQHFKMEALQEQARSGPQGVIREGLTQLTDALSQLPAPLRGARWIRCQTEVSAAIGSPSEKAILAQAREQLAAWDDGLLDRWQQRDLFLAAEQLSDAGALDLLRSAFLHTDIATAGKQALIAAVRGRNSLLWASLDRFKRWSLEDGHTLQMLIEKATGELRVDQVGDACRMLGEALFPEPLTGEVWVGSDGLLAEAPLYAAHHAAHRDHPLPAFRQILGPRRAAIQTPTLQTIASLAADPADLPGAATEVTSEQADLFLRGEEVTIEALRDVRAGLVVLGVHTRHGPRGRYLHFDKPLYPDELAAMPFEGAPVVLLSGCTTAVKSLQRGVEFSFAPALLHAGVSAVIAYRWLISDEEVKTATQALLDRWPAKRPAFWVRDAISELIARGEPAHVWGAMSIY